ncbi:XRCC5 [Cordylochernes scorpioides]|uniref:XRCC5 n=1 Tax=Cordylochernes scorpioides TaxID=51811 RepID=A0ABY6JV09_9ARAC|nr:XRCC5 [Cordylochernes scorpioides]
MVVGKPQGKIFSESKDELALVVSGSPETANDLAEEDQYQNIVTVKGLGLVGWKLLNLVEQLQPSTTPGDFIDALVVSMDILVNQTKGQKFGGGLRLLLFSTFKDSFCLDKLQTIVEGLKRLEIVLTVM